MVRYMVRRIAALGALLGGVLSLIAGAGGGVSAAPPAQGLVRLGPIHVMALDDSEQGYAWADYCRRCQQGVIPPGRAAGLAAPTQAQTTPSSYLLRIEGPRWFVLADSTTAPTLLVPGLDVWRMVVSADGQEGWAAGKIVRAGQPDAPVLFRLHQGAWGSAAEVLAPDYIPIDLAHSAGGTAGWLTARNAAGQYKLWRLEAGTWVESSQPAGATLTYVGVAPGGQAGWAVDSSGATLQAYRLSGQGWQATGAVDVPAGSTSVRLTVDDSGNGWLLAQTGSGEARASVLVRLPAQGTPRVANLAAAAGAATGQAVVINELAVEAQGRGWAVGYVPSSAGAPHPIFLQLSGDSLAAVPASRFSLAADFTLPATVVSVSPNGGTAWIGNETGQMAALSESAPPGMPRTGAGTGGLLGAGLLGLGLLLSGLLLARSRRSAKQAGT
jgi:hypothetical protein